MQIYTHERNAIEEQKKQKRTILYNSKVRDCDNLGYNINVTPV